MPDWMVTCYKQSPPALLAFLALLGILGWAELKSVDGNVGDVSKTLSQTREQMIEGLGNLKTEIVNVKSEIKDSSDKIIRANEQITNAINGRVIRLEERLPR